MFRDRTNLFISYRRTFPHHLNSNNNNKNDRFVSLAEEEEGLIVGANGRHTGEAIEMSTLPPSFFDIASEINESLKFIHNKSTQLNSFYKKNLLPGFNDTTTDEAEIEKLNYIITKKFQECYTLIKRFDVVKSSYKNHDEIVLIDNLKKTYALKIQSASSNFRKLQNNYIKFLKQDDYEELNQLSSNSNSTANHSNLNTYNPALEEESGNIESYSREALKQSSITLQQSNNDALLRQREQEISKIAQGVLEVSSIFREMENMIIEQGTILDRIDYNLENTVIDLKESDRELIGATYYQKRTQKCKIIFLLSLCVFALFLFVLVKPKNNNSSGSSNSTNNGNNQNETNDKNNIQTDDGLNFLYI